MSPNLLTVALRGHYADCENVDGWMPTAELALALDVESCELRLLSEQRVAVDLAYAISLVRPSDDALVCEISATFRLIYGLAAPVEVAELRPLLGARPAQDGWSSFRAWLAATMAWMGLVPVQLPAVAPPELCAIAAELLGGPGDEPPADSPAQTDRV